MSIISYNVTIRALRVKDVELMPTEVINPHRNKFYEKVIKDNTNEAIVLAEAGNEGNALELLECMIPTGTDVLAFTNTADNVSGPHTYKIKINGQRAVTMKAFDPTNDFMIRVPPLAPGRKKSWLELYRVKQAETYGYTIVDSPEEEC